MMMLFKALAIAAVISASTIPLAYAEEADKPAGEFSGTLGMVSDYVYRGITQNDEHPALQGSFDYAHSSGLYFGVWGSNVDFNDGGTTSLEADIYGGLKFFGSGINWDVGGTGIFYPGSHQGADHYDYFEARVAANKSLGPVDATAQINYSPSYFADSGNEAYISLAGTAPISTSGFNFLASAGHQWIQKNANFGVPDYSDWSAGLSYPWQGFDFALKYTDTNLGKADCPDDCAARGIFSVSKSFN
jgi:uncharacterized protein (TIGR02001 family)